MLLDPAPITDPSGGEGVGLVSLASAAAGCLVHPHSRGGSWLHQFGDGATPNSAPSSAGVQWCSSLWPYW